MAPSDSKDSNNPSDKKPINGKRKFHKKSRNGCSTCKKRRVKCDETRPVCNKCSNLKLSCGYVMDPDQPPEKKPCVSKSPELSPGPPQQATPALTPTDEKQTAAPNMSTLLSTFNNKEIPPNMASILGSLDANAAVPLSTAATMQPSAQPSVAASNSKNDFPPGLAPILSSFGITSKSDIPPNLAPLLNSFGITGKADLPANLAPLLNSFGGSNGTSDLLNAGNLNNLNMSHLVNNLLGLGDLSNLGNLANLSSLATLAQLPIDLSNISGALDPQLSNLSTDSTTNDSNSNNDTNSALSSTSKAHCTSQNNYSIPKISNNNIPSNPISQALNSSSLNMLDLRLMFHYTSQVANTITGAGISDTNIWNYDIPLLAFEYPFLMHSLLAFSATHLSRTEKGLVECVTSHRGDALRLLREEVLNINADNTDALVASALILIMDSLANASFPSSTSPKSLPASAWIFHVKGAATILTAVWQLTNSSRFYKFISVDLGDLGDIINNKVNLNSKDANGESQFFTDLECHDAEIADLFPVEINSPYLITLAYLNKLHKERYKSDFILRIFAFPALLDKSFLSLLMTGDIKAMRIMRSYYKLLRSFTTEMKDKVWFLEGVSQVLPVDVEEYAGGAGGMHMMLDFLGGGPSIIANNEIDEEMTKIDPSGSLTKKLIDTNNLPSDITSNLDVMQNDNLYEH